MEEKKTLEVTLDEARELYNSSSKILKAIALKCFSENELKLPSFCEIKTFEDAVKVLKMDIDDANTIVKSIKKTSKATAAMYKLSLIRKALNLGHDFHLTKDPKECSIYYPYNPFVTKGSTYYNDELNSGKIEKIGKIKSEGVEYYILGGCTITDCYTGFGAFYSSDGVGIATANFGFLGCATKEITKHFSKYFGMLITEAKFGDLPDFKITERIY